MFTTPALSAPTLSTTTTPASPTSPTGRSRLRGLSYLRTYTQNHLHVRSDSEGSARNSRPVLPRARSQPGNSNSNSRDGSSTTSAADSAAQTRSSSPPVQSGWLPTVPGRNGTSRATPIRQQSTSSDTPSSEPAPTVTTTEQSIPAPMMTRNRADTAAPALSVRNPLGPRSASNEAQVSADGQMPSIRLIPHFDPRANRPSLTFPAVTRTLPTESTIIRVGRYSERENAPEIPANVPSSAPVGFKSKVVSRRHCEFWCQNSQWYIKDVKSSSGTFLNHLRLSPPGIESRAYPVNDGDVVQLGIDFRGGEEMIFRCVKIRIECNRGWQKALNNFNKKTHKQLRNLAKPKKDSDAASVNSSECSICLMSIAPCQSLFVAPCSHVWHYKCIRPILNGHTWPNFLCPNCRAVADLEADVEEQEADEWEEDVDEAIAASIQESTSGLGSRKGDGSRVNGGGRGDDDEEPDGVRTPRALDPLRMDDGDIERPAQASSSSSASRAGAEAAMVNNRVIADEEPMLPMDLDAADLHHNITNLEDDLLPLTSALSLGSQTQSPPHAESSHHLSGDMSDPEDETTVNISSSNIPSTSSIAAPRPIPGRAVGSYELRPGGATVGVEGPMTPRNDAGPFVLDGGAGRDSVSSGPPARKGLASLDATAEA